MRIIEQLQSQRRAIVTLLALLAIGGLAAAFTLPVALFPHVEFPRIVVNIDAGDRPAERMATEVTMPLEEAVRSVPGLRAVRSTSSRGTSDISVTFDWGQDMISAMLQVESAINKVLPTLPAGTVFDVRRMDPTVFPVIAYSLISKKHSLVELHDIAYWQLRPLLSTVPGVAKVAVLGGAESEYRVTIDPGRLEARNLTLADVSKALSASNTISSVGRIEDHYKLYLAMVDDRQLTERQIGDTVLLKNGSGLVRVADVATVTRDTVPQWIRVTADARDAVIFQVYQQPDANTVQISKDVQAKLAAYRSQLPAGLQIANWYDQSELIVGSAASVRDAVFIGICLAAAVLFLFLRNGKVTLIAVVTVPVTLAATVLLLKVLNGSFNIMTLGGMAAAVGLIIDDAIVMIEHVIRRLRQSAGRARHAIVWHAAGEFTLPLVASSLSTVIIFAPLAFLSGVTGAFFKALSLTMAASLAISFLIAWLGVPVLADHLLGPADANQEEGGKLTERAHHGYERLMRRILARPVLVLWAIVPLLVLAWLGYRNIGSGFMPSMDEGGFILDYRAESGTSLSETDRLLRQVEQILESTPEVQTYSRRTGLQLGGGITEANEGDFFIRLKSDRERGIDEVMSDVRGRVEKTVPGLEIEMAQLMEDLIGDLTAVPQPIEIKLYSDDGALLQGTAKKVAAAIGKVPGVVDVLSGIVLAGDGLVIQVDRAKAGLEGMDPDAVTQEISGLLAGATATSRIESGPKLIGVRAWIPQASRATADAIGNLRLKAPDGHFFPLQRVATLTPVVGQPQINRDELKRMLAVTGRLSGRDLGSSIRDVQTVLARPGLLPRGVYYQLGGTYAQQQQAFGGLIAVFAGAVALVFLLLLVLYRSFRTSLSMLATTLLALSAVTVGLWITHTDLNISSMMGMTMIVGIATEVAIFYVSELVSLPPGLPWHEALIQAGINRMRPIAMTTIAAILALLPLALGIGAGSAMQQPLAIAIISGLILQMPLVLVVLPVLLSRQPTAGHPAGAAVAP